VKSRTLPIPKSQLRCDFEDLLLEAVDAALSPLVDSSKQAIYFYLEMNFALRKQAIPNRIEEFINAIEETFGYGAKILEIEIIKHLYMKIGSAFEIIPEKDDLLFVDYIDAVRKHLRAHTVPQISIAQTAGV